MATDDENEGGTCPKCRRHNLVIKYLLASAGFLTAASGAAGALYQIFS